MVAGHPQEPIPARLSAAPGPDLEAWCALLQQAAQLEGDRGYGDLQGRQERFSAFLCRSLEEAVAWGGPHPPPDDLRQLHQQFLGYPSHPEGRRRQLVAQLRQRLHLWRSQARPQTAPAPPRLRLAATPSGGSARGDVFLPPEAPLAEVPGIGPKIASELLVTHGTLDRLLEHVDEVSGVKRRENLRLHADTARRGRELIRLDACVPIEIPWQAGLCHAPDAERLADFLREMGFKSLLAQLHDFGERPRRVDHNPAVGLSASFG